MRHRSPEKPPCLRPGVNEPEIMRADSHLAAACGYLPLAGASQPRCSPPEPAEFEGEGFFIHTKTSHTGNGSALLLAGQARPRRC